MARIPDGWVFIPKMSDPKLKDGKLVITVSVDERELVMCKNCKHYKEEPYGDVMMCYCSLRYTRQNDYCSMGERKEGE